ncbi:hypothetical protein BD779DRAFT_1464288, partial [Infundibulicybe gibba]
AIDKFCLWADESSEVPKLKNKLYSDYKLLRAEWETLELIKEVLQFEKVKDGIDAGLEKLRKWYMATDETDVYFICLALDPSIKLEYVKQHWGKTYYNAGLKAFESVVCQTL